VKPATIKEVRLYISLDLKGKGGLNSSPSAGFVIRGNIVEQSHDRALEFSNEPDRMVHWSTRSRNRTLGDKLRQFGLVRKHRRELKVGKI